MAAFLGAPQRFFYLLCYLQYFKGTQWGMQANGTVYKVVVRSKPNGLGGIQQRFFFDAAHSLLQQLVRLLNQCFAIAQITAQR